MGHVHDENCGCGCGCGEEMDIITLEFDDGEKVECEALGIFEVDGKDYCALVPVDEDKDDVYLYEYMEKGEEFELVDIEDDDVFEKVVAEFENILEEMDALEEE